MSNILNFQGLQHLQRASSSAAAYACEFQQDAASPNEQWRVQALQQIRYSILMLDLAAQQAHLMSSQIADRQVRQNLIVQVKIVEKLLQVARDMATAL